MIFQIVVMFLVGCANIHWHWTPNPYVAGFFGLLAAMMATALLSRIIGLDHLPAKWPLGRASQKHALNRGQALWGRRQFRHLRDAQRRAE